MDKVKQSGIKTFFKRLLLIIVFVITTMIICYSCSAINKVSSYTIDLNNALGRIYESENQQTVLIINTPEEALINTTQEDYSGLYAIEQKQNVLFLTKGTEEKTIKTVFVSLSENEIFWQSKNLILNKWEEE